MPKMKTRKSASKRYTITKNGKVKYKKQGLRHILSKKSTKRKRKLRKTGVLSPAEVKRAKVLMPYNA
ncbi:MAG: 50S ribosomal protein L35 [Spirochaetaceae bacterium]|nr:MAG: 50S ribosomal protein L35 [Spirochaetaceae bacterium]